MSFSFTVDIPADTDLEKALVVATREAEKKGIIFSGDTTEGSVSGMGVSGSYTISEYVMTITIDKKPFFVSENMIIDGATNVVGNLDLYI
jgi:hypothetical protein